MEFTGALYHVMARGNVRSINAETRPGPHSLRQDDPGPIHMNGRIYALHLARFPQADPFMEDTGTLNRCSNVLVYTDPSAYLSLKEFARIALAVAIAVCSGGVSAVDLASDLIVQP